MLKERTAHPLRLAAMTMGGKRENFGAGEPGEPGGRRDDAEAFDVWLQRGLHKLYDSVANEPVPEELLKLIEQDEADRAK